MKRSVRFLVVLAGLALTLGMTQVSVSATTKLDTSAESGHVVLGVADESSSGGPVIYGSNATVTTTDANPGGRGKFEHYGEHLKACDIQADGNRAVAYLYWVEGGYEHLAWRHDADGANGNCKDNNLSIGEGVYVQLQVCLRDGADGADKWCSSWRGATA